MLDAMGMDKKVVDGKVRLVLAKGMANVVVTDAYRSSERSKQR